MFKRPGPSRADKSFNSATHESGMSETNFANGSTKTLQSTVGRHDGHQDGHLNCVALRHGWTRTFSISPEELATLDYDTLERVLEVHTLKLRPMGVRIFVEHPADSGSWSKIRVWKHDTSLQTILVQKFFEDLRTAGTITRFDVRDGADRRDESDALSLRSVGSRIVHGMHSRGTTVASQASTTRTVPRPTSWFGTLLRRGSSKKSKRPAPAEEDEEGAEQTPQPPAKQSSSIFGYLNPLALFTSGSTPAQPEAQKLVSPEETRAAEVENLRKRGWMPPGLAKRQRSLRERLRASEGQNPFLGGSRVYYRGKKKDTDTENPFADNQADATEYTPQEVDEFFEIDRTSSIMEMNNHPVNNKPVKEKNSWGRLKSGNKKKNKGKQRANELGGAEVVKNPIDAFPNSPHHSQSNLSQKKDDDEEDEY